MSKLVKIFPLLSLALLLLLLPGAATVRADGPNGLSISVSQTNYQLHPGETVMVDVNVQKQSASDNIELKIKTSPLQIRTVEDSVDENQMVHHASVYVTAPADLKAKSYQLAISASNGSKKAKKIRINFNLDSDPGVDFNISSASYSAVDFTFYLGGIGFGSSPQVTVNGQDISSTIVSAQDTMIMMKGSSQDSFNFKVGNNEIVVTVNGRASNKFILILDSPQ